MSERRSSDPHQPGLGESGSSDSAAPREGDSFELSLHGERRREEMLSQLLGLQRRHLARRRRLRAGAAVAGLGLLIGAAVVVATFAGRVSPREGDVPGPPTRADAGAGPTPTVDDRQGWTEARVAADDRDRGPFDGSGPSNGPQRPAPLATASDPSKTDSPPPASSIVRRIGDAPSEGEAQRATARLSAAGRSHASAPSRLIRLGGQSDPWSLGVRRIDDETLIDLLLASGHRTGLISIDGRKRLATPLSSPSATDGDGDDGGARRDGGRRESKIAMEHLYRTIVAWTASRSAGA